MADHVSAERIRDRILTIRGHRVIIDSDLAALYGIRTKRLLEQVRRNQERFPADFCFRLIYEEVAFLRSQFATSRTGSGGRRSLPYAFTEHGALMAANVLNSPRAVQMSVFIIRAFVSLRRTIADHKALAEKLAELDTRVGAHDEQLAAVIAAIRELTTPLDPAHDSKIGFHRGNR
jgi:hypothetical protein